MTKSERTALLQYLHDNSECAEGIFIEPSELVFEENVKMNCFYCGKYNNNWRCPPNLPDIDYPKMMSEYDCGMFVILTYDIKDSAEFTMIRNDSSNTLHKILLSLEKWMWEHNGSNAISFIGGSCKLCKGGCGKEKCNNPYISRSPIEATGVNVIKSLQKWGVSITFPTDKHLKRIGLLLWQEE